MGSTVVVYTVLCLLEAKYCVSGVAVLDIVEGTVLDTLPHMPTILNSRLEGFDSISDVVEWQYVLSISYYFTPLIMCSITAYQIHNITLAQVLVPSLVVPTPEPLSCGCLIMHTHPIFQPNPVACRCRQALANTITHSSFPCASNTYYNSAH